MILDIEFASFSLRQSARPSKELFGIPITYFDLYFECAAQHATDLASEPCRSKPDRAYRCASLSGAEKLPGVLLCTEFSMIFQIGTIPAFLPESEGHVAAYTRPWENQ